MPKIDSEDNLELNQTPTDPFRVEEKEYDQALEEKLTKQIAKGGGISFTGQVVGKGITLLLQILLTRVLGASAYGVYTLGYNVLGISRTFSMLGLQNAVVRFGSMYRGEGDKSRLKGTLLSALVISSGAGVIIAILLLFFADIIATRVFHEPGLTKVLRLFALSLPFYTLMTMAAFSARAFRRMECEVGIQRIFHPLTVLILVWMAFLLGHRLLGAVYGFLISSVLSAVLGIYLLRRIFPELVSNLKSSYGLRTLLSYSLTVLLVGSAHLLIMKTDRVMLGILGLAQDVGIYNAGVVMAVQTTLFLRSFNAIFSPIIADLYNRGHMDQLGNLLKTTTKWIFILTLPIFLMFALFSKEIMGLFGAEFTAGRAALISLGIAHLVNASVGSVGYMLIMTGRQKMELVNSLVLGGLNILLNLLLIPKYRILGAGIATGLSLALVNLVRLLEVYFLYRIHPYKLSYWKPMMAAGVVVVSWLAIRHFIKFRGWFWLAGVAVFVIVYAASLIMLGLEEEDKIVLHGVKRWFTPS